MPLPLASHPLYFLRKVTIASSGVGITFSILSVLANIGSYYNSYGSWIVVLILLSFSVTLCAVDVCQYAHEKKRRERDGEDGDPHWPSKKLMAADFILVVVLVYDYFCVVNEITYRLNCIAPFSWYANLTTLVSGILHGVAFWREVKTRWESAWLESYQARPHTCPRCTYEYIDPVPTNERSPASNKAPTPLPKDPLPFRPQEHPGLAHIASLVRSLNNQVEADLEAGRSCPDQKLNQPGPSRSPKETDTLVMHDEDEEDEKCNGYGSLEVLTPSTDADIVVKKKGPAKAGKKATKGNGFEKFGEGKKDRDEAPT